MDIDDIANMSEEEEQAQIAIAIHKLKNEQVEHFKIILRKAHHRFIFNFLETYCHLFAESHHKDLLAQANKEKRQLRNENKKLRSQNDKFNRSNRILRSDVAYEELEKAYNELRDLVDKQGLKD